MALVFEGFECFDEEVGVSGQVSHEVEVLAVEAAGGDGAADGGGAAQGKDGHVEAVCGAYQGVGGIGNGRHACFGEYTHVGALEAGDEELIVGYFGVFGYFVELELAW